jgi:hypothetical protein
MDPMLRENFIPGRSEEYGEMSVASSRLSDDEIVQAVLDLYKRSLEHTRMRDDDDGTAFSNSFASQTLVGVVGDRDEEPAIAVTCDPSIQEELLSGLCPPSTKFDVKSVPSPIVITFKYLPAFLERLKSCEGPEKGLLCWLHALGGDASIDYVSSQLAMHPVARRLFRDASPQSIVNEVDGESMIVSGVTVFADERVLRSQKVTIYARSGLVVTMERELLAKSSWVGSLSASRRIFQNVTAHLPRAAKLTKVLGPGFIVYLLLMELTRMIASVLDLYAECLGNNQRTVDMRRVTHQARLKIMRDLHNLQVHRPLTRVARCNFVERIIPAPLDSRGSSCSRVTSTTQRLSA